MEHRANLKKGIILAVYAFFFSWNPTPCTQRVRVCATLYALP